MLTAVVPVTATVAPVVSRMSGAVARMSRTSWPVRVLSGPVLGMTWMTLCEGSCGGRGQDGHDPLEVAELLRGLSARVRARALVGLGQHQEWAVEARAELVVDGVVRLAFGGGDRGRAVVRESEAQVRRGERKCDEDAGGGEDGEQGLGNDGLHPASAQGRPAGGSVGVGGPLGLLAAGLRGQPGAGESGEGREQGDRGQDRDKDGPGGTEAHDRQERDADDAECGQSDDHGAAGEDDRAAGGAVGRCDGLLRVGSAGESLTVAGQDEQDVVDAHGQPQHQRERDGGGGDAQRRGEGEQPDETDGHAEQRGQQ